MDFLQLADKTVVVMGVANRKSVAYHVVRILCENQARVVLVVRSEERRGTVQKLFPETPIFVCDVEYPEQIAALRDGLGSSHSRSTAYYIRLRLPIMATA